MELLDRMVILASLEYRLAGKESTCDAGDPSLIPGLGSSPGERTGYPLQYSGLENSMDCIVPGVAKSQTGLSEFHVHFSISSIHQDSPRKNSGVNSHALFQGIFPTQFSCIAGGFFTI